MLAVLLMAAAASTSAPSATPSAEPLKTIVTVKSSPFCGQFAKGANAAITSVVTNDAALGTLLYSLRTNNLAGSSLGRYGTLEHLTSIADAMYRQYRSGEAAVNQLRSLEAQATDEAEKAELKAAADALGGALYRQHLIQRDLDGFLAYLYAGDMRKDSEDMQSVNLGLFGSTDSRYDKNIVMNARSAETGLGVRPYVSPYAGLAGDETPEDDERYATEAMDDFRSRLPAIAGDEVNAAGHIETVATRC